MHELLELRVTTILKAFTDLTTGFRQPYHISQLFYINLYNLEVLDIFFFKL